MGLGAPGLLVHQSLETLLSLHQRNLFLLPLRVQLSDAPLCPRDELATLVDFDLHRWFLRRCPGLCQICLQSLHDWPLDISHRLQRFFESGLTCDVGIDPGSGATWWRSFGTLWLSPTPGNSLLWTWLKTIFGQWPLHGLRTPGIHPEGTSIDCHPLRTMKVRLTQDAKVEQKPKPQHTRKQCVVREFHPAMFFR